MSTRRSADNEIPRRHDDRGIAMLAALMCVIVVVALTTVAVQQSIGSLSSMAQNRKTLQTVDAAEAGLQYEINAIRAADADLPGAQVNCPVGDIPVTLSQSGSSPTTVANDADAASMAYYTLAVTTGTTAPTSANTCTNSGLKVPSGTPWYALIESSGFTSATTGGPVAGQAVEALVKVNANNVAVTTTSSSTSTTSTTVPTATTLVPTYGSLGTFTEALYAQDSLVPGGSFALTDPTGNSGANAFTQGPLICGNSNTFQGVLQAYGEANPEASGACEVSGSLFVDGSLDLTAGAALYQNVYATGAVTLNGGFTISGSVYANGPVIIENGAKVHGTVYAAGAVTMSGGVSVGGNVFATGAVAMSGSASIAGTVEAQVGSISYAGTANSGAAYVNGSAGYTISPCPKNSAGPTSCSTTLPGNFPNISIFPTVATQPAAPPFPTLNYSASAWQQGGYTTITNNDCNADSGNGLDPAGVYAAIVNAAAGTTPTVIRTSCQITWGDDYRKGYSLNLNSNLAIIADGGINFTTAMSSVGSGNGGTHNFYLIVPTTTDAGGSNTTAGTTGGTFCSASSSVGNVVFATNLSSPSTIHDFVYTPNSVCTSGSTSVNGQVYAGGQFQAGGGYTQSWASVPVWGQTGTTGVPVTTTTLPTVNYSGAATAQAANLNMLNGSVAAAASNPATQASYSGTGSGSNDVAQNKPAVSLLSGDSWVQAGILSEYAQANTNGSSFSCSGVVSGGGAVTVGGSGTSCSIGNTGTGAVTLDISKLPGLGTILSSIADVKLQVDGATAVASETANGMPSGTGSLTNADVVASLVGGALNVTVPLTVAGTANENLLTDIISALSGEKGLTKSLLGPLITSLTSSVAPLLSLEANYQNPTSPTAGGKLEVSAIHASLIGQTGATLDLGSVTVGPDGSAVAPTTTTTSTTSTSTTTLPPITVPPGITVVWIKQIA